MDSPPVDIHWNPQLEHILSEEGERALCFSWLHNRSHKQYSAFSTYITIPTVILATLTGSASIGSKSLFGDSDISNVVIGIVSLSIGVLNTVSGYFSWASRAEGHRLSAIAYTKIHRFILIELSLPRPERMAARDMLKVVRDQLDRLQETSPQIPDKVIAEFQKRFGDSTPDIKKPEITNGLDPIYIYADEEEIRNLPTTAQTAKDALRKASIHPALLASRRPSRDESLEQFGTPVLSPISVPTIRISSDDRTPGMLRRSSLVHPPNESEADNNRT